MVRQRWLDQSGGASEPAALDQSGGASEPAALVVVAVVVAAPLVVVVIAVLVVVASSGATRIGSENKSAAVAVWPRPSWSTWPGAVPLGIWA